MADMDRMKDQADLAVDKTKTAVGGALGDGTLKAEGQAGQVVDRLQAAYDERREQIGARFAQVEDFAKAQPWAALAIAAASGLILGRLTAKRRIVYVHRVKPQEVR